jgi:UDPglucose--hexose-1-phosphate uridylyltransferase
MPGLPEWRFDPLTGRTVLISPDRADRPRAVGPACPFCEGHEAETPPEVLAYRDPGSWPNGPGWRVRVVPNRYAALRMDLGEPGASATGVRRMPGASLSPVADAPGSPGSPGIGLAEVFLECPHHETSFRNLSQSQAADVIRAWRDRLQFWRADGRLAYAQVFKNEGPAAGASVEHCHSQLIGVPFVPPQVADELRLCRPADCPFCRWIEAESAGPCFVTASVRFVVVCPPAPRFPAETWILPKRHAADFESLTEADELAAVLLDLLSRVHQAFGGPDFNVIVRSAPFRHDGSFHWRIEVLPRLTTTAGWEWGAGLLINTMFPERAAELLRAAPKTGDDVG